MFENGVEHSTGSNGPLQALQTGQQRIENGLQELRQTLEKMPEAVVTQWLRATHNRQLSSPKEDLAPWYSSPVDDVPVLAAPSLASPSLAHAVSHQVTQVSYARQSVQSHAADGRLSGIVGSSQPVGGFERAWTSLQGHGIQAHPIFQELAAVMRRDDYQRLREMAYAQRMTARGSGAKRVSSRSATANVRPSRLALFFPLHPLSVRRTIFDCISMIILLVDSILVPFVIAWDVDLDGWWQLHAWAVACFWTLDLLLNFCTGYSVGSAVIMSKRAIARRYLKGGFAVDLIVLLIDYADLLVGLLFPGARQGSSIQALRILRFAKITRLVRVVAKLRLGLLARIDAVVSYWVHVYGLVGYTVAYTHYIHLSALLLKLLLLIAWLGHSGSCLWLFLQRSVVESVTESWLAHLQAERAQIPDVDSIGIGEFYMNGWYWAISTMFAGSSYLQPLTNSERILSGIWIIMGALFITAITSALAAILIESQEDQQEMKKKLRMLTVFMEQRDTPVLLALAVRSNMLKRAQESPVFTELDLPFLDTLNPSLRSALRESQFSHCFYQLPFFRLLDVIQESTIRELCFAASSFQVVRGGEQVFSARQDVSHTIILSRGRLRYTYFPGGKRVTHAFTTDRQSICHMPSAAASAAGDIIQTEQVKVQANSWICELALFLHWKTMGDLNMEEAEISGELLLVSVDTFQKVVTQSSVMAAVTSFLADHFSEQLHSSNMDEDDLPTDIYHSFNCDSIIANMHVSLRELVSVPVLEALRQRQNALKSLLRRKTLQDLENEVLDGKCSLVVGPSGEIGRVVRLVVLRLLNPDGLLCIEVAQCQSPLTRSRGKFQLPGRKVDSKEHPADAIQRLLDEDFSTLRPYIRLDKVETVVGYEHSASFDMQTQYIKTVQTATLEAYLELAPNLSQLDPPGTNIVNGSQRSAEGSRALRFSLTGAGTKSTATQGPIGVSPLLLRTLIRGVFATHIDSEFVNPRGHGQSRAGSGSILGDDPSEWMAKKRPFSLYKWVNPPDFESFNRAQAASAISPVLQQVAETPEILSSFVEWHLVPTTRILDNDENDLQEMSQDLSGDAGQSSGFHSEDSGHTCVWEVAA